MGSPEAHCVIFSRWQKEMNKVKSRLQSHIKIQTLPLLILHLHHFAMIIIILHNPTLTADTYSEKDQEEEIAEIPLEIFFSNFSPYASRLQLILVLSHEFLFPSTYFLITLHLIKKSGFVKGLNEFWKTSSLALGGWMK